MPAGILRCAQNDKPGTEVRTRPNYLPENHFLSDEESCGSGGRSGQCLTRLDQAAHHLFGFEIIVHLFVHGYQGL